MATDYSESIETLYLFQEEREKEYILYVYAIDSVSLSVNAVTKLRRGPSFGMGYVAHGSKLYAVGGEHEYLERCPDTDSRVYDYLEGSNSSYPREVLVWDLSKTTTTEWEWEKGPSLNSGKPRPMVVAVKDKIYALAGRSMNHKIGVNETIDPAFEVLDTTASCSSTIGWTKLPDPPFYSCYVEGPGPRLDSYTVVGNTIYVLVELGTSSSFSPDTPLLYSFDVVDNVWKEHPGFYEVPDGLTFGRGFKSTDVSGTNWYFCEPAGSRDIIVRAYDFSKAEKVDATLPDHFGLRYDDLVRHGDLIAWDNYFLCTCGPTWRKVPALRLPVRLLESSNDFCDTLVARLENQMLLVVCMYYPFLYTCLLKLVTREIDIPNADADPDPDADAGSPLPRKYAVFVKEKYHRLPLVFHSISSWSLM